MSEKSTRYPLIEGEVRGVLENLSGRDLKNVDTSVSFFDLGFELAPAHPGQPGAPEKIGREDFLPPALEDLVTIDAVTVYLDKHVPRRQGPRGPSRGCRGRFDLARTRPEWKWEWKRQWPSPEERLCCHHRIHRPDREASASVDEPAARAPPPRGPRRFALGLPPAGTRCRSLPGARPACAGIRAR